MKVLSTDEFLALDYLNMRLTQFIKLALTVKKLILDLVRFYLQTLYPYDNEASTICSEIKAAQNSEDLNTCYKHFLEFLPVRLRAGVQGKFLYRQPGADELAQFAKFYDNNPETIKAFLKNIDEPSDNGFTFEQRLEIMEFLLEEGEGLEI